MTSHNEFGYYRAADGVYVITKNGSDFLTCSGSEADTKRIVELLREDRQVSKSKWPNVNLAEHQTGRPAQTERIIKDDASRIKRNG